MNERIKELIEECTITDLDINGNIYEAKFDKEKFAHKIVEETINELCMQFHWHRIEVSDRKKFYEAIMKTEKQFGYLR